MRTHLLKYFLVKFSLFNVSCVCPTYKIKGNRTFKFFTIEIQKEAEIL